ncbi:MAG TPA: methionyl-tRNA formyltransferase [Terriglobales bacterium]
MNDPLHFVFCGTPRFAVPTLEKLVEAGFPVKLVVTRPDRPKGRGMELAISPVKESAQRLGLSIAQPEKIKVNEEFRSSLEALKPDAIIVVGYGRIIPQWMLDLPPLGNINLHASLLPKYRGAAPIQWAIAKGERVTGVTTMRIDAGLDTGDILLQREMAVLPEDTSETISPRLAARGADLTVETLRGLTDGSLKPVPQDNNHATLAPILQKEDGRINFANTAQEIHNRLRGFQPWPGAFTLFRGKNLNVLAARIADKKISQGEIEIGKDRLFAGCGQNTALELLEVQPEGKKRMAIQAFLNGYRLNTGEKLGA